MVAAIDRFELWAIPNGESEFIHLGLCAEPFPEMDRDFIYYQESVSSPGACGVRKDAITLFKVVAVKKE